VIAIAHKVALTVLLFNRNIFYRVALNVRSLIWPSIILCKLIFSLFWSCNLSQCYGINTFCFHDN